MRNDRVMAAINLRYILCTIPHIKKKVTINTMQRLSRI
jgi:hypothetical protein